MLYDSGNNQTSCFNSVTDEICAKRSQYTLYKISAEIKVYTLFKIQWYLRKIKIMESKYAEILLHALDEIYISAFVFLTTFS